MKQDAFEIYKKKAAKRSEKMDKVIMRTINAWNRLHDAEEAFKKMKGELVVRGEWGLFCEKQGWSSDADFAGFSS